MPTGPPEMNTSQASGVPSWRAVAEPPPGLPSGSAAAGLPSGSATTPDSTSVVKDQTDEIEVLVIHPLPDI